MDSFVGIGPGTHKLSEIGGYLPAGDFLKRLNDVAEKAQKK